jgi:alpha-ketoglutarate-dependent taurine dioxygenase
MTMDPISAAIVAAISAGAIGGLTEASKASLMDIYSKLKALLCKKFGKESEVVQAVQQVEAKPISKARQAVLAEEVATFKADQDAELLQLAQALLQVLQSSTDTTGHSQMATGNYIAQADWGSSASVHIGTPPASPHS